MKMETLTEKQQYNMEILTKRTSDNPNGVITLEEILTQASTLNSSALELVVRSIYQDLEKYYKENELTKGKLNKIFSKNIIDLMAINITFISSIEEDNKVSKGVIYFDSTNDRLRIKTKKGWKTIKLED